MKSCTEIDDDVTSAPPWHDAMSHESHEMQFQSFVERYVATLFAQCRQIATVFETGDRAVANEIPAGIAFPLVDFDISLEDEKEAIWNEFMYVYVKLIGLFWSVSDVLERCVWMLGRTQVLSLHQWINQCINRNNRRNLPDPAGPEQREVPHLDHGASPSQRCSLSSKCVGIHSEVSTVWIPRNRRRTKCSVFWVQASRLQRILDGVASPSFRRRKGTSRCEKSEARGRGSDCTRRTSIRRDVTRFILFLKMLTHSDFEESSMWMLV